MKCIKQTLIHFDDKVIQDQILTSCIEYQDIEYCMANRGRAVYYSEHKSIDCCSAVHEMSNLDWTFSKNGISFINNKTDQSIFFQRLNLDSWYVDTAEKGEGGFTGYFWAATIDTASALAVLRLFFEESDWFSAVTWHRSPDLFERYVL